MRARSTSRKSPGVLEVSRAAATTGLEAASRARAAASLVATWPGEGLAQERWIAARAERLLPARHFHVVFTLPAQLRPLCQHAPRAMYDALFVTATETLLELTTSRWRALPGITSVLHTWTREMWLHPHLHMLVTAGGPDLDGER